MNRAVLLCFYICLSAVFYGYCLTVIGASNLPLLFTYYQISLSKEVTLALVNGALPLGGMLGCMLFPYTNLFATKRYLLSQQGKCTIT